MRKKVGDVKVGRPEKMSLGVFPYWQLWLAGIGFLGLVIICSLVYLGFSGRGGTVELEAGVVDWYEKNPVEKARSDAQKNGWTLEEISVRQEGETVGDVVSQDVEGGSRLESGETLTVEVAEGPELSEVPPFDDQMFSTYVQQLTEADLQPGEVIETFDGAAPEETVLGLQINGEPAAAGDVLPQGSEVDLTVSQGPEPVDTPNVADLVGKPVDEVRPIIEEKGVTVTVKSVSSRSPKGAVVNVIAEKGWFKGGSVTIEQSDGLGEAVMPASAGRLSINLRNSLMGNGIQLKTNPPLAIDQEYTFCVRSVVDADGNPLSKGNKIQTTFVEAAVTGCTPEELAAPDQP